MSKSQRLSNFELLRLVAMLFIVTGHLLINGINRCGFNLPYSFAEDGISNIILNSFVMVGVNSFVMISGWFGIKKVWPQIFRLVFDCILYAALADILSYFLFGHQFTIKNIIHSIDFRSYWFIKHFIILILCSPLLEIVLANVKTSVLGYFVILLTIINVIFGYFDNCLNTNGFNALNFIYVYCIARWLKMCQSSDKYKRIARIGVLLWIVASVLLAFGFVAYTDCLGWSREHTLKYFAYNNPIVLISSVSLFAWFSCLVFRSSVINYLAKGVLGIYLIHGAAAITPYRNQITSALFDKYGYLGFGLAVIIIFFACLALSLIIEWLKQHITPVKSIYSIGTYIENKINLLIKKKEFGY